MSEKMISVVIPVYNNTEFPGTRLNSINSELADIIIIDDGSKDNTLEICKEYEKNHSNVRVYHQENGGPASSREFVIKKATSKYIMFLDSDDAYEDGTIERMIELIEKYKEPDLIRFRYKKVPEGKLQEKYFNESEKYVAKSEFKENVYKMYLNGFMLNAVWSNCVKREILLEAQSRLSDSDKKIKFAEDMLLSLRLFTTIDNAVFVDDVLYRYVYRDTSTTKSKNPQKILNNTKDAIYAYSKLYEYLLEWNMYNKENIGAVEERLKKEVFDLLNRLSAIN